MTAFCFFPAKVWPYASVYRLDISFSALSRNPTAVSGLLHNSGPEYKNHSEQVIENMQDERNQQRSRFLSRESEQHSKAKRKKQKWPAVLLNMDQRKKHACEE